MAHTIIGTAGHIDHGKTLLVRALTGTDTDRTPQEKERGITIELGYAFLGEEATLIDVPGHERFVKTMVAGVSTVDLALLVVAADDGIMPQSREHLDVLELMGVRRGLVVLNKVDLVRDEGEEWLELLEEEVRELTRGTFLEGAEIFRVSALTGEGIDALRGRLVEMVAQTAQRRADGALRLPVDRAFLVKGFGLVCTGTVLDGQLREGESLAILPSGLQVWVRGLQKHGHSVEQVRAGERAALNLAGVEHGQIERGDLLAAPDLFRPTSMFDARLRLLPSAPRALKQLARVRLHLGTREVLARVQLLDRDSLEPGAEGFVQVRLETPGVAVWGDRFAIRRYSPPLTIGGGIVLDPQPGRRRRRDAGALAYLAALESEEAAQVAAARLRRAGERLTSARELAGALGLSPQGAVELLRELEAEGVVERVQAENQEGALHADVSREMERRIEAALRAFHEENPLKLGLGREELRVRSARHAQPELFDYLLAGLGRKGRLAVQGGMVRAVDHRIRFGEEEDTLRARIEAAVNRREFSGLPDAASLASRLAADAEQVKGVLGALQSLGRVVAFDGGLLLHAEVVEWARQELGRYLEENGEITVAQFRALIDSNRKYALALLGYFDREGFSERRGDVRVLKE